MFSSISQLELERLNTATDEINPMELQLDVSIATIKSEVTLAVFVWTFWG